MDHRFPAWLRATLRKLDFIALPNLGMLVCGLTVLGFVGQNFLGVPLERFVFDPVMFREGEWWRIFSYPAGQGLDNPIWVLLFVLYVYFVMSALETQWGTGPLTIYTLLSYLSAIGASLIADRPLNIWYYVIENISLAFGTLFPHLELYLFFVLPVKAKWLALLAGAVLLLQFAVGDLITKAFLAVLLFPYLLFFGPYLYGEIRAWIRRRRNRGRFGG